mgnify:CR=1 FL=1
MLKFISNNEEETKAVGFSLASKLKDRDIVILSGDLGSGKTKFTEGFLSFFGLDDEISSPTFTIVNEYSKNNVNIFHFDVYRLEDLDEFYAIGGPDYFDRGICLIEWGELIEPILSKYIKINISKDDNNDNIRYINIEYINNNEGNNALWKF